MTEFDHTRIEKSEKKDAENGAKALWRRLRSAGGHKCNDLLPSNRVFEHLNLEDSRDLGLQSVPLDKIVGSSGRYREFDLSFRPRRGKSERWLSIAQADRSGLPPVLLYKVADSYFVEDGNHRVSVARANGRASIEAFVVEIDASGLRPDPSCQRLGHRL